MGASGSGVVEGEADGGDAGEAVEASGMGVEQVEAAENVGGGGESADFVKPAVQSLGGEVEAEAFRKAFYAFLEQRSLPFKEPRISAAPICVYALWQAVGQSGGYTAVSSCKLWAAAARMFGASETLTCGGHTMRQNYINSGLHALELAIKGGEVVEGVTLPEESEDAPLVKRAGVPGRRRLRVSDEYPSSATGIPARGPTNRAPTQMSILALVRKSTTNDDGAEGSTEPTVAEFDELLMGDPESVPRVGDAVDVRALSKGLRGAWVPGRVVDVAQGSQWEGGFRFLVAPLPDKDGGGVISPGPSASGREPTEWVPLIHRGAEAQQLPHPLVCLRHSWSATLPCLSAASEPGTRVEGHWGGAWWAGSLLPPEPSPTINTTTNEPQPTTESSSIAAAPMRVLMDPPPDGEGDILTFDAGDLRLAHPEVYTPCHDRITRRLIC
uniref:ARID domain-containing protein n=1 Tax=Tetraselmis chuii TaxID=63592 RepID=A0A7S1SJT2_9CHLO